MRAEQMIINGIYNEAIRKGALKEDLDILLELSFRLKIDAIKDDILETIDMHDSIVEYPHGLEHCILPEHYEELAEEIIELLKK